MTLAIPPRVCSRAQVTQRVLEPTNIHVPKSPVFYLHPSSSSMLSSLNPELFVYHSLPQKHNSFSHPASALSDNWVGSDQYRDLLSLPRAGQTPHCLCGEEDPPDSLEAGIPGSCTAPLQFSSMGKTQHQRCPRPFQDSSIPAAIASTC